MMQLGLFSSLSSVGGGAENQREGEPETRLHDGGNITSADGTPAPTEGVHVRARVSVLHHRCVKSVSTQLRTGPEASGCRWTGQGRTVVVAVALGGGGEG